MSSTPDQHPHSGPEKGRTASPPEVRIGAVCPDERIRDGIGAFPFIVVRLTSAVYQTESLLVRAGDANAIVTPGQSLLRHPHPFGPDGQISGEARTLLLSAVLEAVRKSGFRMCVVWGPAWCTFVEADGSNKNSFDPPSGGMILPSPIEFDKKPETRNPRPQK